MLQAMRFPPKSYNKDLESAEVSYGCILFTLIQTNLQLTVLSSIYSVSVVSLLEMQKLLMINRAIND